METECGDLVTVWTNSQGVRPRRTREGELLLDRGNVVPLRKGAPLVIVRPNVTIEGSFGFHAEDEESFTYHLAISGYGEVMILDKFIGRF